MLRLRGETGGITLPGSFAELRGDSNLGKLIRSFGMDAQATAKIPRPFLQMPDPRRSNRRHKLIDVLTIALFAVVCGADGWVAVTAYGKAKLAWLRTFLDLPHGIPSHDTFGKVFARLDPEAFERCFQEWMASVVELSGGKLVAIDGKSLRQSFEQGWDKSGMAHMVSAFVQANHMVFGQIKTEGKGQELSAIEKLLEMLDLEGAVVSIDALGCQKEMARKILAAQADYVLQAKENQPTLIEKLKVTLDDCLLDDFAGLCSDCFEQTNGGHGRIETRKLWACWNVELLGELAGQWPGLRCMAVLESRRQIIGQEPSVERHYYISSLDRRSTARRLAECIRGHWAVENNLHWQLDISFREDERRIRKGHGAENFSRLCRMALNMLKNEPTQKTGIAIKRQTCGWDNDYLLKVVLT
jgi:predicted transposase YbfD/YdcC